MVPCLTAFSGLSDHLWAAMFNCERRRVSDGDGTGVWDGQWGSLQHRFWRKVSDCRWSRVFNCPSAGKRENLPKYYQYANVLSSHAYVLEKMFLNKISLFPLNSTLRNQSIYRKAITSQPFLNHPRILKWMSIFLCFDSDHLKCDLTTKNSTQNRFSLKSVDRGLLPFISVISPKPTIFFAGCTYF